jgi:hypothetical protein
MECINATSLRRKSGKWGTQLSRISSRTMEKQSWGFAPSFSAHVRSHGKPGQVGEQGAPVQFP